MDDALYIAATGMQAHQKSVETIANNLANISTPGYKQSRVNFADMVYRNLAPAPTGLDQPNAAPAWSGTGVAIASLAKVYSQGEVKQTSSSCMACHNNATTTAGKSADFTYLLQRAQ